MAFQSISKTCILKLFGWEKLENNLSSSFAVKQIILSHK